jgi:negative regulator of flagellin synthesis FlgM
MKINPNNVNSTASAALTNGKTDKVDVKKDRNSAGELAALGKAKVNDSAKINLSERAQNIKKAHDVLSASPDIDEAKVARLQKLIDGGNYKVDAEAIADRLIDEQLIMS